MERDRVVMFVAGVDVVALPDSFASAVTGSWSWADRCSEEWEN